MPYLKKPKKRPRNRTAKRAERVDVYGTRLWRRLRESHMMEHPLCQVCEGLGRVVRAEDVHHIDSFMNYEGEARLQVAYDPKNLLSVCRSCHNWLHRHGGTQFMTIDEIIQLKKNDKGTTR